MLGQGVGILLIIFYLLYWVLYVAFFCVWTMKQLSRLTPPELERYAVAERVSAARNWVSWFGIKGAANLASIGAFVAMGVAIVLSRIEFFRDDWRWLAFGGVAVAGSWIFMVVCFAAEFLELDYAYRAEGEEPLFRFGHTDQPVLEDYLSLALMTSTMGASMPAEPLSRLAWREIRVNTTFAFLFNTMILAMVVSVLSATLAA
nr:Predicted membrane protein [Streptococcus thermophilus]